MKIVGIEGLSGDQLNHELRLGGRFVVYRYCFSLLVVTFRRSSAIAFIRAADNPITKGLRYTAISLFAGWWGIPWGPIWTISSVVTNFRGGDDVTQEVIASLNAAVS